MAAWQRAMYPIVQRTDYPLICTALQPGRSPPPQPPPKPRVAAQQPTPLQSPLPVPDRWAASHSTRPTKLGGDGRLIKEGVQDGMTKLARLTVEGTKGLVSGTVVGTQGLVNDTVERTKGLAKDPVGSIKGGPKKLGGAIMGAVLFRLAVANALRSNLFDPSDLKLITAVLVFIGLVLPSFLGKLKKMRRAEAAQS